MDDVIENVKEEIKQPINLIASIITIINFIWTITAFNNVGGIPTSGIPVGSTAVGFILATLLEAFLAAAFGWAIVYSVSKGKGLPFLLAIVLMVISAWTSLFNIQWLILGRAPNSAGDLVGLAAVGTLYCGFACYLIDDHVESFKLKYSSISDFIESINSEGGLYFWQAISFVVMFGMVWANTTFIG